MKELNMGLRNLAAKMGKYHDRLKSGKAHKIKPHHVEKVLEKLRKKSSELEAEISLARSPERIFRLNMKLDIARAHMERAEWLLKELR